MSKNGYKIFRGYNRRIVKENGDAGGFLVTVETIFGGGGVSGANPLRPRFDIVNHSPDGFAWGYGGSGPGQLALAILAELYSPALAQKHYMKFKWDVIAKLEQGKDWELHEPEIRKLIPEYRPKYTIKFSHPYQKLQGMLQDVPARARLLQVLEVDAGELTEAFREYDTTYDGAVEGLAERYPLPERGTMLLLVFQGMAGLFTTVRPYNEQKAEYYRAATGALFHIEISPEA